MNLANKIIILLSLMLLVLTSSFGSIPSLATKQPNDIVLFKAQKHAHVWSRLAAIFDLDHAEQDPKVKYYIQYYLKNPYYLNEIAQNASAHIGSVIEEIEKRKLPGELALLPIVESDYNPYAKNPRTGANGLWQLMPSTNKLFRTKNLGIDTKLPEYRIVDSTHAALNYLEYLRDFFDGDWLLAIAAYNVGEGRIKKEIKKNQQENMTTSFWDLTLPKETKNFVPKLLALASIMKNPDRYHCRLHLITNIEQQIENNGSVICFENENTQADNLLVVQPPKKAFQHQVKRYQIKPGDSLVKIAKNNKVSLASLKKANKLKSSQIKTGKYLIIPVA